VERREIEVTEKSVSVRIDYYPERGEPSEDPLTQGEYEVTDVRDDGFGKVIHEQDTRKKHGEPSEAFADAANRLLLGEHL
jgi:hypothetical protein